MLWRRIPAPPQRADGFVFGRRGVPYLSVHPGRSPAFIVRHPFHGQGFAGKRAGQQPLQGFHLVPATFLSCLDDTRLQPPDLTLARGPVNLFPSGRLAGGCTRGIIHVHLRFPPVKVLRAISSRTTRWKSARLHGGVMLQPLSAPLQNGLRFFQHPLPAIPSAFLADAPAPQPGRNVGFTMLVSSDTNDLVPASHTGSPGCPCVPSLRWNNRLRCRFWLEPVSAFGSLSMTVPTAVHFCWTYHSACPSDHIDARSRGNLLAEISSSRRWRDVVSAASDPTVTSRAGADRLLRTEPQVRLTNLFSYRTITGTSSLFHTQALLLVATRILRPRSGRDLDAGCPRHSPASRPWPCPVRDRVQSAASPHPRHDRDRVQSVTVSRPCPPPRPQSVPVRDRVRAADVRRQSSSANYPCPRPVRRRGQSMSVFSPCSWTVRDRVESAKCPRHGCIASARRTLHLHALSAHVRI